MAIYDKQIVFCAGWDEHPRASSLRAIFISGSFTGVVAYAGYSAAIVSTLSLNIDPIRTPMELLQSNLHVGVRKGFISILLNQVIMQYRSKVENTSYMCVYYTRKYMVHIFTEKCEGYDVIIL